MLIFYFQTAAPSPNGNTVLYNSAWLHGGLCWWYKFGQEQPNPPFSVKFPGVRTEPLSQQACLPFRFSYATGVDTTNKIYISVLSSDSYLCISPFCKEHRAPETCSSKFHWSTIDKKEQWINWLQLKSLQLASVSTTIPSFIHTLLDFLS